MHKLLVAVLLAHSIPATATTIVKFYSVPSATSFPSPGATINVATWAQAALEDSVNITGATLNWVKFEMSATYNVSGSVKNTSTDINHIRYTALGTVRMRHSTTPAILNLLADGSSVFFDSFQYDPLNQYQPGETKVIPVTPLTWKPTSVLEKTFFPATTGFTEWSSGLGTKQIRMTSTANSSSLADSTNYNAMLSSLISGNLTVTYDFDLPPTSEIPEPATAAMMGGSLVLLGLAGRRFVR